MSDRDAPVNGRLRRIRDRHFDCYLDLARLAAEGLGPPGDDSSPIAGADLLGVLDSELANFRSALEWGLSTGRPETAAFAASLGPYWAVRRQFVEGRRILDRILLNQALAPLDRIDVLLTAARLADEQGDRVQARDLYGLVRELGRSAGDRSRQARAASGHGWMLYLLLAYAEAAEAFTEALEVGEGITAAQRANMLRGLGWARATDEGNAIALELHREARQLLEENADPALPSHYLVEVNLLSRSGLAQESLALADEALALARSGIGALTMAFEARAIAAQALGDRDLFRAAITGGIEAARAEGSAMWQGNFQQRLAHDAMSRGEIDVASDAVDDALRVYNAIETLNFEEARFRSLLLSIRAGLAEDAGELDVAQEARRQVAAAYLESAPHSHAGALAALARLLAAHGDRNGGRLALSRALGIVDGLDEWASRDLRVELAMFDGDLDEALRLITEELDSWSQRGNEVPVLATRRRAGLLAARPSRRGGCCARRSAGGASGRIGLH